MNTKRCTEADRIGRLNKARQFLDAADMIEALVDDDDLLDAEITLCVHAGIAAADVICCARLGEHARGDDHRDAIDLLARVDQERSKDLAKLLRMKTRVGYSAQPASNTNRRIATRSATRLVHAARLV